ncbi:MAG TPA: hypothetical protein VMU73_11020 [Gaiellaceae bacterium]|nr:hypothetical protein [Gaiellaceae bacterium]
MAEIKIVAADDVRAYVLEHGGNVYVWANDAGLKHVATHPPDDPVEFQTIEDNGITLHQDVTIQAPTTEWKLVIRHLPLKHVDALWDAWEPGISSPPPEIS